jgi:hypothetical protein
MKIFNEHMKGEHQLSVIPKVETTGKDLLEVPKVWKFQRNFTECAGNDYSRRTSQ